MKEYQELELGLQHPDLHAGMRVALANVPVLESNIKLGYIGSPNVSPERLQSLMGLLNNVASFRSEDGEKIDLIVFPEVSIPQAWKTMIVAWARRNYVGVICGLEHRVEQDSVAYNEVLAALPYQTPSGHKVCAPITRVKRHYSPHEIFVLENNDLKVPKRKEPYHLFRWRGVSFVVYNCFELANISDRGAFVGKVDLVVATEFNRDVSYFSNIVESAARDIHCYIIQVNDSAYGDGRIVSPAKSEFMNPLRIKGGDSMAYLTMRLDFASLREHQRVLYGLQKDAKVFKPTPPGFSRKQVMKRISLGG